MIQASLASIPVRIESLKRTVRSLLPQVDKLGVYLNGYTGVPKFLRGDPRIDVARSQTHGDRGDAGKFFWAGAQDYDYHLTCDDDLVYPPDFAKRMVDGVERHRRLALIGLHGAMLRRNPEDYHGSRSKVYHCLGTVEGDRTVHVLGTGAMAWHRSLGVPQDIFECPNMADLWLARWANGRGVPRIVLSHRKGWVRSTTQGDTIWSASRRKQGGPMDTSAMQARIARETAWCVSLPPRVDAVVSIVTYKRADALRRLLGDVERERERFGGDVSVRVYDDSSPNYGGIRKLCRERGYVYTAAPKHYGKAKHWRLIDQELSDLRVVPADWYVFLCDDIRLRDHFFARAIAAWETLDRPDAMNLACHSARTGSCWTHVEPREIGAGVEVGWIDGLYICRRPMLEALDFGVPMPSQKFADDWFAKLGSTGVGAVMSRTLVRKGARLYRVQHSLTQHQGVASIMHTKQREVEPLTHMYPAEPFATYEVGKASIAADPADHVGKVIAGGEWYEADVLDAAKATGATGLYVDVGAHVGNHTAYFATECGASVLAIEPNAASYARLVATVEASGVKDRVRCVRAAVHPTWKTGRVVPGPADNSGMTRVTDGGSRGTVPVVRLDDAIGDTHVGVIKVDVEGNVSGVIESGRNVIMRDHPVIIAEASAQEKDAATKLLAAMGYCEPIGHYGWTPVWFWVSDTSNHKRPPVPERTASKTVPRRGGPRVSLAMMAHPARKASVERILAILDRECPVVWDEKNDRWDTGKRAMLAYDPEATHHVVIQDDVLVCRDLCAGLERALAHIPPDAPLCGYVGRVRPQTEAVLRAVAAARKAHASFIVMRCLNWGPLVAVPTGVIPEMVAHGDTLRRVPNYDRRLSRFFELEERRSVWYTWPSLVDHADGPSMVKGRFATDREREPRARVAHEFIGEQASALDIDWTGQIIGVEYQSESPSRGARKSAPHSRYAAEQPHAYTGPVVVFRHKRTGQELRLPTHSPRIRRMRGVPQWERIEG